MAETATHMRLLVVDDERLSRVTAVRRLGKKGFSVDAVDNAYKALEALAARPYDALLCDLRMPGMDGLELLDVVRRNYPTIDVIVMTAYGSVETAVAAIKAGAVDYLTKPFRYEELEHRLRQLQELQGYRREISGLRSLLDSDAAVCGILGRSPGMREAVERVQTFALHPTAVLVTGETGTGKELVARALHQLGPRARQPFVAVACGAIPAELAESELLGHEKGAFSGAIAQRFGAFERAHRGTLLLDDVDDLPMALQVKLLRALQEGCFVRVGGSEEIEVDVRVVATTKVDLEEAVAAGNFRSDLFYRLRALEIHLPPLRERGEDVLLLAEHFMRKLGDDRAGPRTLGPEAAAQLLRYGWPGNVRELRHVIESAIAVCDRESIEPRCLPDFIRPRGTQGNELFTLHLESLEAVPFSEVLHRVEARLIEWAMRRAGGQQTRAAELLGLPRSTLRDRLGKHGGN